MTEIEIVNILKVLKTVNHSRVKDMHMRYDEEAYTMYINFGAPVTADDSELDENDILYRYRKGEIVGVTVTHFTSR
ncbi:MAG: DUF2283 domain-containing protein [Chryseotalea sp. WA131a]|jgi:uncharacterized protein YuzE|nr:MAG: DUF2283 domain-containing protein [Chryseotalea sp. WA131a]